MAAVSGGCDSVALLQLLVRHARGRDITVGVAHLDHGMRRGSVGDRRFVEALARRLGVPCTSDRREVPRLRRKDESPEEAARRVRRGFLLEARQSSGATSGVTSGVTVIATGHTVDDQAETVLMRLVRGAGPAALAGMRSQGPGPFVRPLLDLERSDLEEYLKGRGESFREDPSNRDLQFDRNRVRRLLIPQIAETLNPRAARQLVKAAALLREDADYLDGLAQDEFRRIASVASGKALLLDVPALARLPQPMAGRVARLALATAGIDPRRIATRHIAALIDLARGPGGRELDLPGGIRAFRRGQRIRLKNDSAGIKIDTL
jgi:tRNA(Ile)-lysidine synthase